MAAGPFDLSGQVVIVTGASRGLGKAMALSLGEVGATVVLVARNADTLAQTAKEIGERGGQSVSFVCDVTKQDEVNGLVQEVIKTCGKIDVLVNNAGIAWERQALDISLEDFRETLEVNVVGTFLMAQACGRHMAERRRGKIINIGSLDAVVGASSLVHYCTSKGAVVQFTRGLAVEWAKYNIQVNCLCPGYFRTEINAAAMANEKVATKILANIPAKRFAEPTELGPSVIFLASSGSDYMTGQVILLDGGSSAR